MTKLNVSQARNEFSEIVNRAAFGRKRTVISRRGKAVAAVVPIADLELLKQLQKAEMDRQDIADALAAKKEGGSKPLEEFGKEMGW